MNNQKHTASCLNTHKTQRTSTRAHTRTHTHAHTHAHTHTLSLSVLTRTRVTLRPGRRFCWAKMSSFSRTSASSCQSLWFLSGLANSAVRPRNSFCRVGLARSRCDSNVLSACSTNCASCLYSGLSSKSGVQSKEEGLVRSGSRLFFPPFPPPFPLLPLLLFLPPSFFLSPFHTHTHTLSLALPSTRQKQKKKDAEILTIVITVIGRGLNHLGHAGGCSALLATGTGIAERRVGVVGACELRRI